MPAADPLYPATAARCSHRVSVDGGHELHVAEFGNPAGTPALFLHGGPGSGCSPQHARLFDPRGYRLIQPDQRGSGRSRPHGEIRDNHTDALLEDIETVRRRLAIDRWLVHGGSWGATLAIEYAKRYPSRVRRLVLRAPFLARHEDLAWFTSPAGVARELPDAYARLRADLGCRDDDDLVARLYERLCPGEDPDRAYRAALAWDTWEATVMGLANPKAEHEADERARRIGRKRIYAHYCRHRFFLGDAGVMPGIDRLDAIPGTIVHGTRDRVCRYPASQRLVAQHLPSFTLETIDGAGHGLHETALQAALRRTLDAALDARPDRD